MHTLHFIDLPPGRTGLNAVVLGALVFFMGASAFACEVALGGPLTSALGAVAYGAVFVFVALALGCAMGTAIALRPATRPSRALLIHGGALVFAGAIDLGVAAITRRSHSPALAMLALVPAFNAGLLFPPIARFAQRAHNGSRRLGALFAALLAGCAAGAALSVCVVVPRLGPQTGVRVAALLAALSAALGVAYAWRAPDDPLDTSPSPTSARAKATAVTSAPVPFAAAALAVLAGAAIVALMHLVRIVTEDAEHTFGTALLTASVGLAFGAARARKVRIRHRHAAVARSLAAAGLAVAITLPLWSAVPWLFAVASSSLTHGQASVAEAAVLTVVIALPVSWLGTSLVSLLSPRHPGDPVSHGVARIALATALGVAIGAALMGTLVLPVLGSQRALAASAIALMVLSLAIGDRPFVLTAMATMASIVLAPTWDPRQLAFGVAKAKGALAWSHEDPLTGYAAITQNGVLAANGRVAVDPEAGFDDRREALLAMLLAPNHGRAQIESLSLGTLEALTLGHWRAIELRTASPALAAAARVYLGPAARTALADPRVVRVPETSLGAYDVVLADAPRGCTEARCAREWFDALRISLTESGVAAVALPLASHRAGNLATLAAVARLRFPHVALAVLPTRALLVVTRGPLSVPRARMAELALRFEAGPAVETVVATDAAIDACTRTLNPAEPLSTASLRACTSDAAAHALVSP